MHYPAIVIRVPAPTIGTPSADPPIMYVPFDMIELASKMVGQPCKPEHEHEHALACHSGGTIIMSTEETFPWDHKCWLSTWEHEKQHLVRGYVHGEKGETLQTCYPKG